MSEDFRAERQEVVDALQRIVAAGLVSVASGNVSCKIRRPGGDLYAITASRVPYHRFGIDDVVVVDSEIEPVFGEGIPSSESLVHMAVYAARPDVGAVIHSHSQYASAFAVAGAPIPAILDEQVVVLGGSVHVAEYGASASEQLAENAVRALGTSAAVLLRNHGVLGVGHALDEAVAVVELVERVAKIAILSAAIGGAQDLSPEVVSAERAVYRMMKGFKER